MDECAIVGWGTAQATLEEIARLRKDPGPGRPEALDFQILKHADEHTVLALAAMLNGVTTVPHPSLSPPGHEDGLRGADRFGDWGVVAAPRWPGRFGTASALERYRADGPRGVSPMAIPNVCLHSLSGTVSLVFQMRGPNFGVGGGLASVSDGLLAGLILQLEQRLPGTWVILSEWDVEPGHLDARTTPRVQALALALRPVEQAPCARRLALRATSATTGFATGRKEARQPPRNGDEEAFSPRLAGLIDHLRCSAGAKAAWKAPLDWGAELVLTEGESMT
jgi:hypothetical protein